MKPLGCSITAITIILFINMQVMSSTSDEYYKLRHDGVRRTVKIVLGHVRSSLMAAPSLAQYYRNDDTADKKKIDDYCNKTKERIIHLLEDRLLKVMSEIEATLMKGEQVADCLRKEVIHLTRQLSIFGIEDPTKDESFLKRVIEKAKELMIKIHTLLYAMDETVVNTNGRYTSGNNTFREYSPSGQIRSNPATKATELLNFLAKMNYENLKQSLLKQFYQTPNFRNITEEEFLLTRLANTYKVSLNSRCALLSYCKVRRSSICGKVTGSCRKKRHDSETVSAKIHLQMADEEIVRMWRKEIVDFTFVLSKPILQELEVSVIEMIERRVFKIMEIIFDVGRRLFRLFGRILNYPGTYFAIKFLLKLFIYQ